ncbi:MAG TPA: FAD:protein FMN transferase [Sphingobacterium sp.]|nr:FAD:protein FMN transferase [Sphingobacterium sp.]
MRFVKVFCFLIGVSNIVSAQDSELEQYTIRGRAQGTTYSISYFHRDKAVHKAKIDSLFDSVDRSMSLYRKGTLINRFNNSKNNSVIMDKHMKEVVKASFKANEMSEGLFDITVQPLTQVWGFSTDKQTHFPKAHEIDSVLNFVGMDKINIKGDTLYKLSPHVQLDLDGIAPGYTADYIATFLQKMGISNFVVEVGGEVFVKGRKPNGEKLRIAINKPSSADGQTIIELENEAVATSGSYEQYRKYKGKTYTHHIDPRTGYPIKNKTISATIIAPKAISADALSSICMLMTPKESGKFISQLKNVELFLLYEENNELKELQSSGFSKYILAKTQ